MCWVVGCDRCGRDRWGRAAIGLLWDGRDEAGKAVAAGVYIYQVEVDGRAEAKKTTKLP